MRNSIFVLALLAAPNAVAAPAPELARLSWMIGEWTFVDEATPAAGFEYAERGERVCAWTLDDRYIECVSTGRTARATRTYRHLWTWNEELRRIELVSLFGNTPSRGLAFGDVSADGATITLSGEPETENGITSTYLYVIRYDGARGYVWESSRHQSTDPPETWTVRFIDRATHNE